MRKPIEDILREHTVFASMDDMLDADYEPSFNVDIRARARLANEYDRRQCKRGDGKRAHRYRGVGGWRRGGPKQAIERIKREQDDD